MTLRQQIIFPFLCILLSGCSTFKGERSIAQIDQNEFIKAHNKALGTYVLESGTSSCPKILELQWLKGKVGNTAIFLDHSGKYSYGFSNYGELGNEVELIESAYVEAEGNTDSEVEVNEKYYHSKEIREFKFVEGILFSYHSSKVHKAKSLGDKSFKGKKIEARELVVEVDYNKNSKITYKYIEKKERTPLDFRGKSIEMECFLKKKF